MRVSKWGNSLAVRLPKAVMDELELTAGDRLEIVPIIIHIWPHYLDTVRPYGSQ